MSAKIIPFRPRTVWTPPLPPEPTTPVGCVIVNPIRTILLGAVA